MLIENGREIPPAASDLEIGEVAEPDLIHALRCSLSNSVGILSKPAMGSGCPAVNANYSGAPTARAHESFNPAPTEPVTARREGAMDARTPVGTAAGLEDATHLFE